MGIMTGGAVNAAEIPSGSGYTIVDTCYSAELGVYVVVTKNLSDASHPAEILYSENGEIWSKATGISNARNYGNPHTRQTVVWWAKEQKFIAILGGNLLESSDGKTWTANTDLKNASEANSNTILETNGEELIVNRENRINVFESETAQPLKVNFGGANTYGKGLGISTSNDTNRYVVFDGWQQWRIDENGESAVRSVTIGNGSIYDLEYSSVMNGWFITGPGVHPIFFDNVSNSFTRMTGLSLSDGTLETSYVTAMALNGSYVLAGTVGGKVYVTDEDRPSLSATSEVWEQVMPLSEADSISGEIRSVSAVDENTFFFGSERSIYKAVKGDDGWTYYDITSSEIVLPEEMARIEVPESGSVTVNIAPQSLTRTGEPSLNTITNVSLITEFPYGVSVYPYTDNVNVTVNSDVSGGHTLTFRVTTVSGQQEDVNVEIVNQASLDVDGFEELVIPQSGEGDNTYEFSAVVIGTDGKPMSRKAIMEVLSLPNGVEFDAESGIFTVKESATGGSLVLSIYSKAQPSNKVQKEIKIAPRHVMYAEITDGAEEFEIPEKGTETLQYSAKFYDQVKEEITNIEPNWQIIAGNISTLEGISIDAANGKLNIEAKADRGTVKVITSPIEGVSAEKELVLKFGSLRMAQEDIKENAVNEDTPITENLNLADSGSFGSKITWKSSDEKLIGEDGTVSRPSREDKKVTLTARAVLNGKTAEKAYKLIVKKAENLLAGETEWQPIGDTAVNTVTEAEKVFTRFNGEGVYKKATLTNDSSYAFEAKIKSAAGNTITISSKSQGKIATVTADGSDMEIKAELSYRKQKSSFEDEIYVKCSGENDISEFKMYEITKELSALANAVNKADYSANEKDIEYARSILEGFYDLPSKKEYEKILSAIKPKNDKPSYGGGSGGGGTRRNEILPQYATNGAETAVVILEPKADDNYADVLDTYLLKFKDMKYHWARADVEFMGEKGIISGYDDGGFHPDSNITRAEFAVLISAIMGKGKTDYENSFFDIVKDDWYSGYVQTVRDSELMNGYDGLFNPDKPITREEIAKVVVCVYNAKKNTKPEKGKPIYFNDIDEISYWAYDYVAEAVNLEFVNGITEETLAPKALATRAQAAVMLKRLYEKINETN